MLFNQIGCVSEERNNTVDLEFSALRVHRVAWSLPLKCNES